MNLDLEKRKINYKSTICTYLNNSLGKPRKIQKDFARIDKIREKELNFAKN